MKILILEPYLTGSHASWAEGYAARSGHDVSILGLEGRHWKWRMHGGAVLLAERFLSGRLDPDVIVAGDMLDLSVFLSLTRRKTSGLKTAVYFHENQISYPWSQGDEDPARGRDLHYGFINYTSTLAADRCLFNSRYHMESFLGGLPGFLARFPDRRELPGVDAIRARSSVLHLGMDLERLDRSREEPAGDGKPLILWNHRWEYDKNPGEFFSALFSLQDEGLEFEVAILGKSFSREPEVFSEARKRLGRRIVRCGYVDDPGEYARWLWRADILPVTSHHDFFGASVVEALYCGCRPLLPRRLAYPEHVPEELHPDVFYDTPDRFLIMLRESIKSPGTDHSEAFRKHVSRYDWSSVAPLYDGLFEDL